MIKLLFAIALLTLEQTVFGYILRSALPPGAIVHWPLEWFPLVWAGALTIVTITGAAIAALSKDV